MQTSAPPLPPGPPPQHVLQPVPPITEMLYREGNAWAALLSLHAGVLASAKHGSTASDGDSTLCSNREQVEMREAAYCAALTNLASQADALASEALKLRHLRRVRSSEEVKVILMPLVEAHSIETMAMGGTLAGNSALSIQATATGIRQAHTRTRSQLTQLHALIGVVAEATETTGLRLALSINERLVTLETVLEEVYKFSSSITVDGLARALQQLRVGESTQVAAPAPQRSVARRHGPDRTPAPAVPATAIQPPST